jgi:hypothetical protein
MMEGAREDRTAQLLLEGSRRRSAEEVGVGKLLQSGKGKRYAEEGPKDEQGAARRAKERYEA